MDVGAQEMDMMPPVDRNPLPVKSGDWVVAKADGGKIAIVKSAKWDTGRVVVDLVLYDRNGGKIGRASPPLGGPRTYEPNLDYADWRRIEKPNFPITLRWELQGDDLAAVYDSPAVLPDREWLPARGASAASRITPTISRKRQIGATVPTPNRALNRIRNV